MSDNRTVGKWSWVFFLVGMIAVMAPGCKSEDVPTHWAHKTIAIDGKIDDWSNTPVMYMEEEDIGLGLCSDSQYLYIMVKFRDPKWLRAIRMTGLNVWIDKYGNKDTDFGLKYNGIPEALSDLEGQGNQSRHNQMSGPGNIMEQNPIELRLTDKNSIFREAIIASDGSEGPQVAADTSMSFIVYEMSIPLGESESRYYGVGTEAGEKIALGFIWGDMEEMQKNMKADRNGMGGGRGGGMGGQGGGKSGRGGGMGQRPGGNMEKQEIWVKTSLASLNTTDEK